jgi:2-polyprenyl-3-methyl-5-hydroxy-6-metoxy-1,4-benzoquinol methylase
MSVKDFGSCPVCGGLKARALFSINTPFSEFRIVRCELCELARTCPLPSDEVLHVHDINSYYGGDVHKFNPYIQEIRNIIMRVRAKYYLSFIPDSVQTPKILDVGCAEGRLLSAFLGYGCRCWGIEHPSYPSQRFLNSDQIVYLQGDLQAADLPEEAFDLIFLWHALEHMDEPHLIITRLYQLLAPKGAIIVAVPNFSSMEARRFKRFWFHLDIPWHKYHFNERSLGYLLAKSHLRIMKMSTLCFEQGPYGLLQSILNAFGWPHNEFYEALKGSLNYRRSIYLMIQFFMVFFLLIPVFFVNLFTSNKARGPVLKLIIKKEETKVCEG